MRFFSSLLLALLVGACGGQEAERFDLAGAAGECTAPASLMVPTHGASVLEIANTASAEELEAELGKDVAARVIAAREAAPFDAVQELSCLSLGENEFATLLAAAQERCGTGGVNVTPRMCAPFAALCEGTACQATSGVYRLEGRVLSDAVLTVPAEIEINGANYSARYPDGRTELGTLEQSIQVASPNIFYLGLHGEAGSHWFHLEFESAGIRLNPLTGPAGRDVETPLLKRQ